MQEKNCIFSTLELFNLQSPTPVVLLDFLNSKTNLSKSRLKDALNKGAVWLTKKGGKRRRFRRAKYTLAPGDKVSIYFNENILKVLPHKPALIADYKHYSIWSKPAGVLSQGNNYSDHCSIGRIIEKEIFPKRKTFAVHRLDREATGLILIAHSKESAAIYSKLFKDRLIEKKYCVEVLGEWHEQPVGIIDFLLDGKTASTSYNLLKTDKKRSVLEVSIETGRLHQIRRHLDLIGYPVIGDPRYGTGNKNEQGMRLKSTELAFHCPILKKKVHHRISNDFNTLL